MAGQPAADLVISKPGYVCKVSRLRVVSGSASLRPPLGHHGRRECNQVRGIPAIQRRVLYLSSFNYLADRPRLGLQKWGLAIDADSFAHIAQRKGRIEEYGCVNFDINGLLREVLEARAPNLHAIGPRYEVHESIAASTVGRSCTLLGGL